MAIPKNKVDLAKREDEAEARILADRRAKRILEIRIARDFRRIDLSAHFVYSSCVSVIEYGCKKGYSPWETRTLVAAGAALEAVPELEARLIEGSLTLDAVAALSPILVHPDFAAEQAKWIHLGETSDLRALDRLVKQKLAEAEKKELVLPKTILLTVEEEKVFFEARCVAMKK